MQKGNPTWRWLVSISALMTVVLLISACSGEEAETTETTAAVSAQLTVQADTVMGSENIPAEERGGVVCVQNNLFPRNSEIVWRARVTDPVSGTQLSDDDLESVQVTLGDGQVLDMHYGGHPNDNPADFFWTTSFDIPSDYPTGTLSYEIVATDASGRTGNFSQFQVTPSLLTVTEETLEPVEDTG